MYSDTLMWLQPEKVHPLLLLLFAPVFIECKTEAPCIYLHISSKNKQTTTIASPIMYPCRWSLKSTIPGWSYCDIITSHQPAPKSLNLPPPFYPHFRLISIHPALISIWPHLKRVTGFPAPSSPTLIYFKSFFIYFFCQVLWRRNCLQHFC